MDLKYIEIGDERERIAQYKYVLSSTQKLYIHEKIK